MTTEPLDTYDILSEDVTEHTLLKSRDLPFQDSFQTHNFVTPLDKTRMLHILVDGNHPSFQGHDLKVNEDVVPSQECLTPGYNVAALKALSEAFPDSTLSLESIGHINGHPSIITSYFDGYDYSGHHDYPQNTFWDFVNSVIALPEGTDNALLARQFIEQNFITDSSDNPDKVNDEIETNMVLNEETLNHLQKMAAFLREQGYNFKVDEKTLSWCGDKNMMVIQSLDLTPNPEHAKRVSVDFTQDLAPIVNRHTRNHNNGILEDFEPLVENNFVFKP